VGLPGAAGASAPSRRRGLARPPAQAWLFGDAARDESVRELLPLEIHASPRPTRPWVRARLSELKKPAPRPDGLASVIVPCWNGLKYTKDCLRGVLERTEGDFE